MPNEGCYLSQNRGRYAYEPSLLSTSHGLSWVHGSNVKAYVFETTLIPQSWMYSNSQTVLVQGCPVYHTVGTYSAFMQYLAIIKQLPSGSTTAIWRWLQKRGRGF